MIIHISLLLKVGILSFEACELFLRQVEIIELVFEYHARIIQSVHNGEIARCHLVFGKWYLRKIILTLMWVVLRTILELLQRVLRQLSLCYRVFLLFGKLHVGIAIKVAHHSFVHTLPVVGILALSPKFFESLLTLLHSHSIIEIPHSILTVVLLSLRSIVSIGIISVARSAIALHGLLSILFVFQSFLLFLLSFQFCYHPIDGSISVFLAHLCQSLQRVLQMYGVGIRHQLVKHL